MWFIFHIVSTTLQIYFNLEIMNQQKLWKSFYQKPKQNDQGNVSNNYNLVRWYNINLLLMRLEKCRNS